MIPPILRDQLATAGISGSPDSTTLKPFTTVGKQESSEGPQQLSAVPPDAKITDFASAQERQETDRSGGAKD